MRVQSRARSERGASAVEYAIVVGVIGVVLILVAAALGTNVQSALCSAGRAFGGPQSCTAAAPAGAPSPSPSPSASSSGGSSGSGGSGGGVTTPGGATTASQGGSGETAGSPDSASTASGQSGTPGGATASASASASVAANSAGNQQLYLATIDQDQLISDLSIRFNAGWQPSNWNNVTYPTTTVVDVTWSPALEVDQVIPGSDGTWTSTLVSPGHLRLVRTGPFDATGFQPAPEILLKKPATTTVVTANFSLATANTPALSATASTRSTPY